MHKAITILQFKVEAAIIKRHPEWNMEDRLLLEHINFKNGTCNIGGKDYEMTDTFFPTINPDNPCELTPEEETLMKRLRHSFTVNEKLHKHMRLMLSHGSLYTIINDNLLFHASIPLNDDGSLKQVALFGGKSYKGRELMNHTEQIIRSAFQNDSDPQEKDYAIDYFLYLWSVVTQCCSTNQKWLPLNDIFSQTARPTKKRKATISNYVMMRTSAIPFLTLSELAAQTDISSMVMSPFMQQAAKTQ